MTHPDRFLLAGVMGWPVMHSRSPMLHNYWFKQHGLAGTYVPLAVRPEGLAAALRALHPLGFAGCNLTIPHKQEAMKIVNEVDALASSRKNQNARPPKIGPRSMNGLRPKRSDSAPKMGAPSSSAR